MTCVGREGQATDPVTDFVFVLQAYHRTVLIEDRQESNVFDGSEDPATRDDRGALEAKPSALW